MTENTFRLLGELEDEPAGPVARGRNVAAVIGIDAYTHWRRLNNAVSDAEGVRKLFVEHLGYKELTPPLYDEQATLEAINALVLDQLPSLLQADDSLVLFFAGHGHTEQSKLGDTQVRTGYLIPVGGQLPQQKKFSSYLKLDSFLKDVSRLPARHVIVILDACYSGFALGESVTVQRDYDAYTDDLDRRVSRHVIASAMHDQPALDNGPIVGHSLFTGTLIEGLQLGQADADRKGFVTGSELALFVQKEVSRFAEDRGVSQTPDYGYFDLHQRGELVISLRGETQNKRQAAECLEIARRVMELARLTGSREQFQFAAKTCREAIRYAGLAKMAYPEAELVLGQALLACGETGEAVQVLAGVSQGDDAPAATLLFLGMARSAQGDTPAAAEALTAWLAANPQDANAGWVRVYLEWLGGSGPQGGGGQQASGKKLALLIGINTYRLGRSMRIYGSVNDVERLMKPLLVGKCGFPAGGVTVLTDKDARRAAIAAAFERLKTESRPEDTLVVHYSGHSVPASSPQVFGENDAEQVYLIVNDTQRREGALVNGISAPELHAWMQAIPAGHKTLILDTHASFELVELARREGNYALILASDTAEVAYEWEIQIEGDRVPCGLLTGALYQAISQAAEPQKLTYREWMRPAIQVAAQASASEPNRPLQTPYFVGLAERRAFGGEDPYWDAFELVLRGPRPGQTLAEIVKRYMLFRLEAPAPHPAVHATYGRIFLQMGDGEHARQAYGAALAPSSEPGLLSTQPAPGEPAGAHLELYLGQAELLSGDLPAAQTRLSKIMKEELDSSLHQPLGALLERLPQLKPGGVQVTFLLPAVHDETEDAGYYRQEIDEIKRVLTRRVGPGWIGVKADDAVEMRALYRAGDLTRSGVLAALDQAQAAALAGRPALFCWLGADMDFTTQGPDRRARFRSAGEDWLEQEALETATRDTPGLFIWVKPFDPLLAADGADRADWNVLVDALSAVAPGETTHAVFQRSLETGIAGTTGEFARKTYSYYAQGEQPLLVDPAAWEVSQALKALLNAPVHSLIEFLQEVIDRREGQDDLWPDGRLCLGVAHAAVGDYEAARRRLEEVIEICENGGRGWNKNMAMAL